MTKRYYIAQILNIISFSMNSRSRQYFRRESSLKAFASFGSHLSRYGLTGVTLNAGLGCQSIESFIVALNLSIFIRS
ncbi:TPA: hypothetical protein DEG21_04010 [Patescibacteria group bacterium]|nr:hypothetical protein [Candidatus Gracilibacteria bacterium]